MHSVVELLGGCGGGSRETGRSSEPVDSAAQCSRGSFAVFNQKDESKIVNANEESTATAKAC